MLNIIIVIPARWASSRLPGKPLIKIKNIPMIARTYNQCSKVFSKDKIIVATDDKKIKKFCEKSKIKLVMTSKSCLTGTDRVAEVARKIRADIYINVQGDEPFFNPSDLKKLIKCVKKNPTKIYNGYTKIESEKMFKDPSIPKVVFNKKEELMYMSRGKIPSNKRLKFKQAWRQVCAYAFPRKILLEFKKNKKTELEYQEDIEILRFLELGKRVQMVKMSDKSISIDTKKDLILANKILK